MATGSGVPAARPLVAAALAVAAGSWLGSSHGTPTWEASGALRSAGTLAAATVVVLCANRPIGLRLAPLNPCWLVALVCAAALRAGLQPGAARAPRELAAARVPLVFEGPLRIAWRDGHEMVATLGGDPAGERSPVRWALRRGLARAGERVRVYASPATPFASDGGPRPVSPDALVRLSANRGNNTAGRVRARVRARLGQIDHPQARALVHALLLGDTSALGPQWKARLGHCGLRHLLAVSGWHVGCIAWIALSPLAAACACLLRRAGLTRQRSRGAALVLSALGIAAYIAISGAAAPVRRAGLTLILARAVEELRNSQRPHRADALSSWGLALLIECLLGAGAVRQLSVQLSYAATFGLIVIAAPLARLARPARPSLGPPNAARIVTGVLRRALVGTCAASAAAILATLPIAWSAFGEWSPIGVVATAACVPWCAWLLVGGLLALASPALLTPLLGAAAEAWWFVLRAVDALPGTPLPLPARPVELVALLVLVTLIVVARGGCVRLLAFGWAALAAPWSPHPAGLQLVVLDVGHGTCVVWRAPGEGTWIFDAGSRDRPRVGQTVLAPLLARWEVRRPAIVLSHADRDHAAALGWLLERYPPRLWAGALPAPWGERLPHTCPRLDLRTGTLRLPTRNADWAVWLHRGLDVEGNEGSRCLELDGPAGRFLLFGDAEEAGMRALLAEIGLLGPTEGILVPHHGSAQPSLGTLLERFQPRESWISASRRPPVADELERRGNAWSWTGGGGSIERAWARWDAPRIGWHGTR